MICQFAAVSPGGTIIKGTVANSVRSAWNLLIIDVYLGLSTKTRDDRQAALRAEGYRVMPVWVSVEPPAKMPPPSPPAGQRRA